MNVVFIEIIKKIQSFNVSEAKYVSASKGNRDESFKCPLSFSLHSSILYSLQFEGQKNIIVIKRDFAERYDKYTDIFCFPWHRVQRSKNVDKFMSCGSANEMDIDYLNEFFFGLHKSLLGFVIIIAIRK